MCQLVSVCVSPALKCLVSINKRGNGRPQNSQTHGRHTPLMTSASRQETALCNKSKMVLLRPDAVVTALLRLCSFFDFCTVVVVAIPISPLLYLHNLHVTTSRIVNLDNRTIGCSWFFSFTNFNFKDVSCYSRTIWVSLFHVNSVSNWVNSEKCCKRDSCFWKESLLRVGNEYQVTL